MNAPNRWESFVLDDGEKPVEVIEDTKVPNAATFKIYKQDHTLANMIRGELLNTPGVLFAGYKIPHPLEPVAVIKLQTDGTRSHTEVMEAACTHLISTISKLQDNFKLEFSAREVDMGETEDAYGSVNTLGANAGAAWGSGRDYMDF